MKIKLVSFIFLFFIITNIYSLTANNGQNINIYEHDDFKVGISTEISYLRGTTSEEVYSVGYLWDRQISELEWEIDDLVLGGGVISLAIKNKIYLNFGAWGKISSSKGNMDDSDWMAFYYWIGDTNNDGWLDLYIDNLRTHFSRSNVEVDKAYMLDFNASYTFLTLDGDTITSFFPSKSLKAYATFQGIVGYKYDKWRWIAKGGHYLYNLYTSSSYVGQFDYVPVVTFENDLHVPYIGISANLNNEKFGISIYYLFSKWAEVDDTDYHLLRDLKFKDNFNGAEFNSWGINLKWDIGRSWILNGSYQYEHLKHVRGDTTIIDLTTNESVLYPYIAGFSNWNSSFSLSLTLKFL